MNPFDPTHNPEPLSRPSPCCEGHAKPSQTFVFPMAPEEPCSGAPDASEAGKPELPGYQLFAFVEEFIETPAGRIPRVKTVLSKTDYAGAAMARIGINREQYRIAPGLYCVGQPDPTSPVLVTANYKLTFDGLRKELDRTDAWLLVLDTKGINVWCAAGKGTFSSAEVIRQVKRTGIERVVRHRRLILPQLSATGVSAVEVKQGCGFKVTWGPVRARDLKSFLRAGLKAAPHMRRVTFTLPERLAVVPVELYHLIKPSLWILAALLVLSGIGSSVFSPGSAFSRGWIAICAYLAAIFAGAIATPALLPWIPGRAFAAKGALTGAIAGIITCLFFAVRISAWDAVALLAWTATISSYLAMNFTGATPFTSPSGVEKEMRKAIPLQIAGLAVALIIWVAGGFVA